MQNRKIKFALFSDFHYRENLYLTSLADMDRILERANENKVDFVIHAGDFCNNYSESLEITNRYLNNFFNLPVYGIYGNHELEGKNRMKNVTPLLNNREVVWGTSDGKIGDGSIAYFYFDVNGFRIVCTDTNYSYNQESDEWQHNLPESWGPPEENLKENSLAPIQIEWLQSVLMDSAEKSIPCIVLSHASFSVVWGNSPDGETVRQIFKKANERRRGTVLMAINGDLHTNRANIIDDVLYFGVNSVRNGYWAPSKKHYGALSADIINYDEQGNEIGKTKTLLDDLKQGANTWFFEGPLSAIVTVSASGKIKVEGAQTSWIGGIVPPTDGQNGTEPRISDMECAISR